MRSGLVQTGAWAAATGAAVALSWLGVNAVLSDAAFEPPRVALPLAASTPDLPPAASGAAGVSPTPTATSTPTPAPTATASGSASETGRQATVSTSPSAAPRGATPVAGRATPSPGPTPGAPSSVHSYLVPGGRVALDMHPDSAELVSATPDPGWQMQLWNGDQWMRIDFSRDGAANSVFVTWNGHAPDVQTVVR